jgi:ABC-2 type transport system permease protein
VAGERLPGTLAHVLPPGGFALYIGATEWITLSQPSIHLRLEDDIRAGALDARLLRPKSHLVLRFAESLGEMLARLAALGVAALALLAASGRPAPIEGLLLLAVAAVPGAVIGLLLFTLVGLAAFWVRRTLPAYLIIQKLMFLMGGLFAPISLYPGPFRRLCEASPFAANLYWPAAQLLTPSPTMLARTLGWQAAWIVVLSLIVALVWDAGVQRTLRRGI